MSSASALKADYRLAVFGTEGSAFAEFNAPVVRVFGGEAPGTGWRDDIYGSQSGALVTEDEHFLAVVRGTPVLADHACRRPRRAGRRDRDGRVGVGRTPGPGRGRASVST